MNTITIVRTFDTFAEATDKEVCKIIAMNTLLSIQRSRVIGWRLERKPDDASTVKLTLRLK